jgi:hypothetical protein
VTDRSGLPVDVAEVTDAQELWRLLVTVSGDGERAPAVAVDAFRRVHEVGQPGRLDSALLLCTDWRWRRTSARVLAGILEAEILDDADQDRLADDLLWSDKVSYVHPLGWIGSSFVEIEIGAPRSRPPSPQRRTVRVDPTTPVTTQRSVWPPLRSWAAQRVLVRDRAAPADVLERARALPARDAAFVVTGAVYAANDIDPRQARTIVDVALRWGQKPPRKAALERLVAWGEADRAHALAADDPDASIRAWGRKLHADVGVQTRLFD